MKRKIYNKLLGGGKHIVHSALYDSTYIIIVFS